MAWKQPEQSPDYKFERPPTLAELVNERRMQLGMTQKDVAIRANMSETRLNRILRGRRGRGNTVFVTEHDIDQLVLALKMGRAGRDKLRYAAWPELALIDEALDACESVVTLNIKLYENGLPTLGIGNPDD